MSARVATAAKTAQKVQRERRICSSSPLARNGSTVALDGLIRRYTPFVRLKASAYFLVGGGNDDPIQEGLIGLYKAVRDFRPDKETSFRLLRELCVTRQDHHGDQDGDALQALAAQHLRLVQPHARRQDPGRRLHARRCATRI